MFTCIYIMLVFRIKQKNQFDYLSKKDGKDQEKIQSSTTSDQGYHMGKKQKYNKHHQQEPRGQPFPSRWPQGSNEQVRKHEKHKTQKTQMIHKRSTALERSVKIFYWGA